MMQVKEKKKSTGLYHCGTSFLSHFSYWSNTCRHYPIVLGGDSPMPKLFFAITIEKINSLAITIL